MNFSSLRSRIAAYYALLLVAVMATVAVVIAFQVRSILMDEAKARIDRVGADIVRLAEARDPLAGLGDALPISQELASPSNLERWASPTTYVEIDDANGYALGKSSNLGSASLAAPIPRDAAPSYARVEPALGETLVRSQRITTADGQTIVARVGERLDLVREALRRIFVLLAIAVAAAAAAVVAASFTIAARAIAPINDLTRAIDDIGSEQLDRRVAWRSRTDEVGRLAHAFDALLARLEEAFARERQFISDASHELKSPLTVINANAQMLERWGDRDPEIRSESLRAIVAESAALAQIVSGMLVLAKAESGDDIPREPLSLERLLEAVRDHALPRAQAKDLALTVVAPPDGASTLVLGDANLLRQLFTNIVENAIKFTERGSVEIALHASADRVVVDVADTGIGIEDEALARIFDRFYRTDASHSRAVEGTGLGLAIARSIARVHDGRVSAARNERGGTTFRIELPRLEPSLIPVS